MFQQSSSFTNQADDYLQTLLQNRFHNHHNDQDIESDFTPFMKRHSSSGDSYVRDHEFHYRGEASSGEDQRSENDEDMSMMEKSGQFSKRYQPQNEFDEETKQNTKFEDSFLKLVDEHLSNIHKEKQTVIQQNPSQLSAQSITLSKIQISHSLLQNQSIIDSIQITNLLSTKSVAKIINSPFEFRLLNAKNKFIKKDQVEIALEPYETVEVQFEIKKRENEIGNIYETMKIETYEMVENEKRKQLQKKYLKFEITFVKPKLEVTFLGKTIVKRIQEHKIAHFQIHPNQLNQYFINLIFSQEQFSTLTSSKLQRIECQIQAKGYISVHPTSVILYQDEPLKIVVRKLSQLTGANKTSAIVIRPVGSSLVYVVGVKCVEKKGEKKGEENTVKMAKFAF